MKTLAVGLLLSYIPTEFFAQEKVVKRLSINSDNADFAPQIYDRGIVFASSRKSNILRAELDAQGKFTTDLYYSVHHQGKYQKPDLFSQDLTSVLNEGPFCFNKEGSEVYVTKNIISESGHQYLGIFKSNKYDTFWNTLSPITINSNDGSYNVAHPFLTNKDKRLFFVSDKPGGYGGYDIYFTDMNDAGEWSEPKNAGPEINSSKNEGFPFISHQGILYFSSNGWKEDTDVDIYRAHEDINGKWVEREALEKNINSEADDYGFVTELNGQIGYFSSNRQNRSGADLYSVELDKFDFSNCQKNYEPFFCYFIQDEKIDLEDGEHSFIYEWSLGDGEIRYGRQIEYCYEDFGSYNVELKITDSLTNQVIAEVSNFQIQIEKKEIPHINSPDTIYVDELSMFYLDELDNVPFETKDYFWDVGTDDAEIGYEVPVIPKEVTTQRIYAGAYGFNRPRQDKVCVYKDVTVLKRKKEFRTYRSIKKRTVEGEKSPWVPDLQELKKSLKSGQIEGFEDSTFYYIELFQSKVPKELSDSIFQNIESIIVERYIEETEMYSYSTEDEESIQALMTLYYQLVTQEFKDAIIKEESRYDYNQEIRKSGYFMSETEQRMIEEELNKLASIHFEYNSYEILEKSFNNLDQISLLLKKNPFMGLKIKAHTDNIGDPQYNLELSKKRAKAVVDYFIFHGIDEERLEAIGYGSDRPKDTNETEKGRSKNRRVEFEIVVEKTHSE